MEPSRILIVEDEIIIARELEARLIAMGYEVTAIASSGPEAIEQAGLTKPDLILMDIVIKGDMDGIEAASEIRRIHQIPVIYLTAYTDKKTLERARITEPFGYIVKPFSERELEANIEMALYKHRMETHLRKMERWMTDTVNGHPYAVVAADIDGKITLFNRAAEVITEWDQVEAVGKKLGEILRLMYKSSGKAVPLELAVNTPVVCFADDTVLIDRSNREIPIDNTTSCIRDAEDKPKGTVSVFRDVTDQRHVGLANLNSDVTLATTQAVNVQGMLQLCAESMVRNLDAAFARIWTLDTTLGNTLVLQASAGMYTHLNGTHGKVPVGELKIGRIAQTREPHLTNDVPNDPLISDPEWARAQRMVAFAGYPLLVDNRLVGVLAMFARHTLSDTVLETLGSISRAVAIGIDRKRLEERLAQTAKMEAIGRLAGGVAHDFNNLLMVISGGSEILLGKNDLSPESRNLLEEIAKAGKRAESLTRQLLAFSRKQTVELRVIDLNGLVTGMEKMLKRLVGEDIDLRVELDPDVEIVRVDPGQIEQVLMNLVINSRDAMPQGGKITIETSNTELDDYYEQAHPDAKAGNYVQLAVSDTGCGMSAEVIERIFEPFFTTKDLGKGTGLGLATVFGVVKQLEGSIEVYSELEIGTTFKIYLPRVETESPVGQPPVYLEPMPEGTETILLVEDEGAVRQLCRRVLEGCGYHVVEAGNGLEALEISESFEGPIHLVLTDVVMPGLGGRSFAEQLSKKRSGVPILYMSGYTDDAVIRHGILRAETAFIQKPFTPSALATRVRRILDAEGGKS